MNWPTAMVVLSCLWIAFLVWLIRTMIKNSDEEKK